MFDAGIGLGDAPAVRTFTISNAAGAADLTIGSATLVGTGFTLLTDLTGTVLQGGQSVTLRGGDRHRDRRHPLGDDPINNNDANEALYDFVVTGTVGPRNIVGSDAVNDAFVATAEPERFDGLNGTDTVSYANGTGPVVASLLTPDQEYRLRGRRPLHLDRKPDRVGLQRHADRQYRHNVLEGGLGADKLDGGTGIDTASYANACGWRHGRSAQGRSIPARRWATPTRTSRTCWARPSTTRSVGNTLSNAHRGGAGDDTLDRQWRHRHADRRARRRHLPLQHHQGGGGTTGDIITDFVSGDDSIGILRSGFKILAVSIRRGGALDSPRIIS